MFSSVKTGRLFSGCVLISLCLMFLFIASKSAIAVVVEDAPFAILGFAFGVPLAILMADSARRLWSD